MVMTWLLTPVELPRADVQAKIQSPMITNKSKKKSGPFENMCFNGKTNLNISDKKRTETELLDVSENYSGTPRP